MSNRAEIDSDEAYAFLTVVAPRLEQLRRRLVVANNHLRDSDPETGRLTAIIESQLAVKEFMSGLADLRALVEPIDIVLEAVRDEQAAPPPNAETQDAEPPRPEPAPVEAAKPEPAAVPATPKTQPDETNDFWLQIGTTLAVDRLVAAGMTATSAEFQIEDIYASVGLTLADGSRISDETIKEWRAKYGGRKNTWRSDGIKRRLGGAGVKNPLLDARARVNDMAGTFKRIALLAAAKRR